MSTQCAAQAIQVGGPANDDDDIDRGVHEFIADTNVGGSTRLHQRLNRVDREYDRKIRDAREASQGATPAVSADPSTPPGTAAATGGLEARMLAFGRQCELRAREWAASEGERLAAAAVSKVREEERARYSDKLAQMKREFNRAIEDHENELQRRIADAEAAAKARHAQADRANYEARQRLIAMMDRAQVGERAHKPAVLPLFSHAKHINHVSSSRFPHFLCFFSRFLFFTSLNAASAYSY